MAHHPAPVPKDVLEAQLEERHRTLLYGHGPELSMLYATLGNAPKMLAAWLDVAWAIRLDPDSPRKLRELAIVLVGRRFGAPYEVRAHTRMALDAGATAEQMAELTTWRDSVHFDETERAVLALADAMVANQVADEHTGAVERLIGPAQLIEIIMSVGYYQMVSSVTQALRLDQRG
jgi:4-carboxymuconolactone decarboxylase